MRPPCSRPASTSTGSNLLSPRSTTITVRRPVGMSASVGTSTASREVAGEMARVTYMPGFSFMPGLPSSTRARTVRLAATTSGSTALIRPANFSPG